MPIFQMRYLRLKELRKPPKGSTACVPHPSDFITLNTTMGSLTSSREREARIRGCRVGT